MRPIQVTVQSIFISVRPPGEARCKYARPYNPNGRTSTRRPPIFWGGIFAIFMRVQRFPQVREFLLVRIYWFKSFKRRPDALPGWKLFRMRQGRGVLRSHVGYWEKPMMSWKTYMIG